MFIQYPDGPFFRDDLSSRVERVPWWLAEKHWVYLVTTDKGLIVGYVTYYDSTNDTLHIKAIMNGTVKEITEITSFITKSIYFTSSSKLK